ncbi:hypothetical protein MRX96_055569 [Rhipicephalus microplus]
MCPGPETSYRARTIRSKRQRASAQPRLRKGGLCSPSGGGPGSVGDADQYAAGSPFFADPRRSCEGGEGEEDAAKRVYRMRLS